MASIPQTIREQVTSQIRDELVSGNFPAGATLRESELAERFGVSRGPIRDAFLQLSHEGFLAYQANRGVTVRHPPDPADREFITSLRKQVETHVIRKGLVRLSDESLRENRSDFDEADGRLPQRRRCGDRPLRYGVPRIDFDWLWR